jgi:hypothetical protein
LAARRRTAADLIDYLGLDPNAPAEHLALATESMVSYVHTALEWWIKHGSPDRDRLFLGYTSSTILAWRKAACESLGLGDPAMFIPLSPRWFKPSS